MLVALTVGANVFLMLGLNEAGKRLEPNDDGIEKLERFSLMLGAFLPTTVSKMPAVLVVLAMACTTAVVVAANDDCLLLLFVVVVEAAVALLLVLVITELTPNTDILDRLAASALFGLTLLVLDDPVPAF